MGLKPLLVIFVLIIALSGYLIAGSESVSKKIEKYTDDNYKTDKVKYEKYTFMNATYCNWTAKYARALELLDKYESYFYLEENKEKSQFLRARTYDNMIEGRRAKAEYEKYIQDFPNGKNIKKARERYQDLKSYL